VSLHLTSRYVASEEARPESRSSTIHCRQRNLMFEYSSRFRFGNADLVGNLLWFEVIHRCCIVRRAFRATSLVSSSWARQSDGE
jgi:hypothetical protein